MKKSITIILMFIFVNGYSQTAKNTDLKNDTLIVDVIKAKYIKVGDKLYKVEELKDPQKISIFTSLDWALMVYQFLETATSNNSKSQISALQQPLNVYWQYYLDQVQKQKNK